jgi:transmembrane sensor
MKENPYANMDKGAYRIAYLIAGYIRGTITEKEHDELNDWVNASDHNMLLFEELTDEENIEANLEWMDKVKTEESFQDLQSRGKFITPGKRFTLNPVWMAAASVILLAGIFFIYQYAAKDMSKNAPPDSDLSALQPGGNKATLTLENGEVIDLTSAKNGLVNADSSIVIIKVQDGKMVYDDDNLSGKTAVMHTLATPVGGKFQVTLPDGTRVWLNSSSSLKYPSRFTGNERTVQLSGEGYFEVAKNIEKPFRVLSGNMNVEVIGTHFNINAYQDEPFFAATLLEGSVKVSSGSNSKLLTPGQQSAIINNDIRISIVDTSNIIAWKNNEFKFTDATIETIMRQVQRWYGAEVVYQEKVAHHFNATIERSESIDNLLHYLEGTGQVHFKLENKKIIVMK